MCRAPSLARLALAFLAGLLLPAPANGEPAGGLIDPFTKLSWSPHGIQVAGQFGFSAFPAGDIDGDGFGDVLVGAPFEDNSQPDEGRLHVFLGSATGPGAAPARIHFTGQGSAYGGWSVAPAGDVNGDGFADYVMGVPNWDTPAHTDAGKIMVYHGAATLPFNPTYERFSPVPAAGQRFGLAVMTAGDVNGDGYDDLLVGTTSYAEGGFTNRGAVFVFHGGPGGLEATPARTWVGPAENGSFGASISPAGDVNGDGFADVLVGAPGASSNIGAAHVFLGSAAGAVATADTVIAGTAAGENCGASVANAGDVNGDGYADILVGSPGFGGGAGRCRLVHGGPFGPGTGVFLANSESGSAEFFGLRSATLGDLDGDGFADIGVTSRNASGGGRGRIVVFRGGRSQVSYVGDVLTPGGTTGYFGNTLATAGDTDGDGLTEILVGTEDWSIGPTSYEGRVFTYAAPIGVPKLSTGWPRSGAQPGTGYGSAVSFLTHPHGFLFPQLAIGDPGHNSFGRVSFHSGSITAAIGSGEATGTILGTTNSQNLGARLADVGDINRDSYSDLAISSTTLDNGAIAQAGRVDLYPGGISGLQAPGLVLAGGRDFDRVGTALAGRGDVNGDGYHDFVVGAREWDSASLADCGKAWVYFGSASGPGASPWTREGSVAGQGLGASVAMGDFDGDGYSDVAIGSAAPPTAALPPAGKVEIFYGGSAGLSVTPGLVLTGLVPHVSYGSVVAAIGDVNGDTFCDLGVGAPLQDDRGMVFVYAGTPGRSQSNIPIQTYTGIQVGARLGAAIAGGGDVDGDGIGDFAIGSPGVDGVGVDEGRLDVYRGAPYVPMQAPFFSFSPGVTGLRLGESIAPFVDANHDGFADVATGGPGAAGRVYPFLGGPGPGHFATLILYEPNVGNKVRVHPARVDATNEVWTQMLYASPGGRSRIGIQFEAVTQNSPFTGLPTQSTGLIYDSGAPSNATGPLASAIRVFPSVSLPWPGTGYRVRARFVTRSPFFPRSRWITPEAHTSGDLDVWTAGAVVDAAGNGAGAGVARLAAPWPNPASGTAATRISWSLPQSAEVTIDLHDVRGARVRRLHRGTAPAGASSAAWDGLDEAGRRVAPGLYFVRLSSGETSDRARVVRLP